MGLDTRDLRDLLLIYPQLDQGYLCKQGQHYRRRWGGCQAFVAWKPLVMRVQVQTDLSLDDAVDQQAQHRQHRQGRDPFWLLQPHGGDRRGILDPPKTRFHSGVLVLIGLKNLHVCTALPAYRRRQHCPPIVLVKIGQGLNLDGHSIARLKRQWVHLRWPASTGTARAACVCHHAIVDRVIPPGTWATPSASRPLALIRGDSRFGIGPAGEPLSL